MKRHTTLNRFITTIICLLLPLCSNAAQNKVTNIRIGTGSITGIYYPTGAAICKIFNIYRPSKNIRCIPLPTAGSLSNMQSLTKHEIDFGFIESEIQHELYHDKKNTDIRSVFSLYQESFTILVRQDSNIHSFNDIKNKRVNIGAKGSGVRQTADMLFKAYGYNHNDFPKVTQYNMYQQAEELCKGNIDVAMYMVGHPNGAIQEALHLCKIKILPLSDQKILDFLKMYTHYSKTIIPGKLYIDHNDDIKTIGVTATLVAMNTLDKKLVYNIVKIIFEHFEQFKLSHPTFATLKQQQMLKDGLTAPLHEGALEYYREIGLE